MDARQLRTRRPNPCFGGSLLCLLLAAGAALGEPHPGAVSQAQVEAAFLYNFTKFVEWPDHAAHRPIVIGVLGESRLTADLRAIVADRKVNGRAIVVRTVATLDEVKAVQILFVESEADAWFQALKDGLGDAPVLTVGESAAFIGAGGAIRFVARDSKLRFEINVGAAERARLKVSAQLQELATAVVRRP